MALHFCKPRHSSRFRGFTVRLNGQESKNISNQSIAQVCSDPWTAYLEHEADNIITGHRGTPKSISVLTERRVHVHMDDERMHWCLLSDRSI